MMAKKMKSAAWILAILTAGLWLWNDGGDGILLSAAITASTALYHFGMRLLVGSGVNALMHNRADCHGPWFRPRKWEKKLYQVLQVRHWKQKMPTYAPEAFDGTRHTLKEIAEAMCQAEIVHELGAALSFLPLLAVPYVGALPVFLITSILAAGFDLCFAVIQRYNRPRILRILEKQN